MSVTLAARISVAATLLSIALIALLPSAPLPFAAISPLA
jgi:hypothetical protein